MTIRFNKSEEFKKAKAALAKAMTEGTEAEQQSEFVNYLDVLQSEVTAEVAKQVNVEMMDRSILQNRGQNVLTSEETKFFQNAIDKKGFDEDSILPVTTQDRIFEDLVAEHPLLNALGLVDMGAVTRIITSDPEGAAVWGPLFGDIKGQLGATFGEEEITQLKLTAFAVVPNDMLELGPVWVERYVRTIAVEAISVGLERGFVLGGGAAKHEPVGLTKDVRPDGAVVDKAPSGVLTFEPGRTTVTELKNVVKGLSKNAKGKVRRVAGRIVAVVNPFDHFDIVAASTTQNSNGVYTSNLPFNPQIVESEFVTEGTVIFFIRGEYLAVTAGGYKLKKFDQTLAIEDATLYTIKQFANGKPRDNNSSVVYTLNIEDGVSGVPEV
ncbi:phage major capsid protein [Bacillus lacus]|uniref:Phage major capsid protein n=1 Tax=Metabacillus lacus TaxID=1983721 RepID=A0A7X2LX33_9BACI|nr:phage major capsid protein [Metabacillus lacus]MRX70851.1 phage major capsid protein [Metabacillus lacus]